MKCFVIFLILIGFMGLLMITETNITYGLSEDEKDQTYYDAESYFTRGNFTKAIQLYDAILEVDPDYSDAIAGKGAAYHRMGDFATAIDHYDKAIAINATNPFFLSDKGNALLALGIDGEAEKHLKKALDILPYE